MRTDDNPNQHSEPTQSLREVVHYTIDGIFCADCRAPLTVPPATPYLPGTVVVMLDKDPRATWVTTIRKPNCRRRS